MNTNFWREGGDGFGVVISQGMLALLFLRKWMIGADSAVSNSPSQRGKPFSRNLCILGWRYDTPPITDTRFKNGVRSRSYSLMDRNITFFWYKCLHSLLSPPFFPLFFPIHYSNWIYTAIFKKQGRREKYIYVYCTYFVSYIQQ